MVRSKTVENGGLGKEVGLRQEGEGREFGISKNAFGDLNSVEKETGWSLILQENKSRVIPRTKLTEPTEEAQGGRPVGNNERKTALTKKGLPSGSHLGKISQDRKAKRNPPDLQNAPKQSRLSPGKGEREGEKQVGGGGAVSRRRGHRKEPGRYKFELSDRGKKNQPFLAKKAGGMEREKFHTERKKLRPLANLSP